MKTAIPTGETETIEHALQRLVWTEQKKFAALLAVHDLTYPQFLALVSVKRHSAGCPIGALADETYQAYPTMTGIVDRLQEKRLVERERGNVQDRRLVVVKLTPAGQELLALAWTAWRDRINRACDHISSHERREFLRLLTAYLDALDKEQE
jgi:DNA-binding MarR family transcriptional regulator